MEISSAHHHHRRQAMGSGHPLEEIILAGNCPKSAQQQDQKASRARPQPEQALKCPRCDSTNTKFCYYNNYSLSQPRYFCKGCRRYWTKGGSLRNVPVGGGCRKNKRSSSSSSSNSSSSKNKSQEQAIVNSNPLLPTLPPLPPPALSYDPCSDLTLAFSMLHKHDNNFLLPNPNPNPNYPSHISTSGFLDILRSGWPTAGLVHNNPYCGLGGNGSVEEVVLPVDQGGYGDQGSCKALDGGESKGVIGHHQWQVGGDGSVGVEATRDYWNGVGSFWHGIINSSLM